MIQSFPYQYRPSAPLVSSETGVPVRDGIDLLLALYNRTGGGSGIPLSVGNNLAAIGNSQATALALINDLNEVLKGAGGVLLYALKPSQGQAIFNGSGAGIDVYPPVGGQIDALGANAPYALANNKMQIFTCWGLLASGVPYFRSMQLG